jgi:hypothetical protein
MEESTAYLFWDYPKFHKYVFYDGLIQNAHYKRRKLNFGNSPQPINMWHIYTTIYWIAQVIPIHCSFEFFNLPFEHNDTHICSIQVSNFNKEPIW